MSKKKTAVMEKERQNFVYGNEAEGVKAVLQMVLMKRRPIIFMMK